MSQYAGKTVVVTGADGFIGSRLVERLVEAGANVRALAYYNSFGSAGWLDESTAVRAQIDLRSGDVRDPYFVATLIEKADIVFHLAALIAIPYSYVAPQSYVDVNVAGTLNVLEACRRHGVERLIHTSTSEVYGTALFTPITEAHPLQGQSPYSASKIGADKMVESYVRSFELPATILRPFNTYGPRQSERAVIPTVIRQLLDPACDAVRLGDTSPVRDFTFVDDTVAAFLAIGAAPGIEYGVPYNGGTGQGWTIGETVDLLVKLSGSSKPVVTEQQRLRPKGSEVLTLLADHSALSAATGWQPQLSLEDGLAKTIEWWRNRIATGQVRLNAGYQI